MLKQIDQMKSIMTEKVLGTEIEYDVESETFSVLFGLEIEKNKCAKNLERGWSYLKGPVASIMFDTEEEAQDYANKMLNSNLDYNDWLKHKSVAKEQKEEKIKPEFRAYEFLEKLDFYLDTFSNKKDNEVVYKSRYSDNGVWTEIRFIYKEERFNYNKRWTCIIVGRDSKGRQTSEVPIITTQLSKAIYKYLDEVNYNNIKE